MANKEQLSISLKLEDLHKEQEKTQQQRRAQNTKQIIDKELLQLVMLAIVRLRRRPTSKGPKEAKASVIDLAKFQIFKSLESWVSESILPLRKPVEKCWQPIEFLPDPSLRPDAFVEEVWALRQRVLGLSDELATEGGDTVLARICGTIAADENRAGLWLGRRPRGPR
ncbi:hypothetical protein RND71_013787 [Anisodus tanguticus]|uniref:Uncharacterized protein n=1 Tax=Anisodus tanguticus TaxID=243964 RepID=A0AAE1SA47_9SOLA|nr:hypothetical protein RND71_013787 [Anisodus tanguticus]